MNWRQVTVLPGTSVQEVIEVLNRTGQQIVLVANADDTLAGTVTDGDVRRALLSKLSLTEPVEKIMCVQPTVVTEKASNLQVRSLMTRKSLAQIPVLRNKKIVGLHTMSSIGNIQSRKNPVFLMAGGFGTRLRPLTNNCPKPLLKVGDKPILETILEGFVEEGFYNFYISTHYLHEQVEEYFGDGSKWGVQITYVHEKFPLGTGGALSLLPSDIEDLPLIMMNGDLLTKVNFTQLLEFHAESNASATMCVRQHEIQVPYGVIQSADQFITDIVEKPLQSFFINAGIYVVSPELRKSLRPSTKVDMPDLLQAQIDQRNPVAMFPIHEYWLDIGKMPDFEQAQLDYQVSFGQPSVSIN